MPTISETNSRLCAHNLAETLVLFAFRSDVLFAVGKSLPRKPAAVSSPSGDRSALLRSEHRHVATGNLISLPAGPAHDRLVGELGFLQ